MAKKGHGHHGGAWKVAYADFVTAMMALFLVLWLTSQDEKIKEAVARSFRNPFSSVTKDSTGLIPSKDTQAVSSSAGNFDSASAVELAMLRRMFEDYRKTLEANPETPDDNPIGIDATPNGMRITVFDRVRRPVFKPDSADFTEYGEWLFTTLAWQIARYSSGLSIELEGHTERSAPPKPADLVWNLSVDRASRARAKIFEHGVRPAQIHKVSGFGDTIPVKGSEPLDPINRRVTICMNLKPGEGMGQ